MLQEQNGQSTADIIKNINLSVSGDLSSIKEQLNKLVKKIDDDIKSLVIIANTYRNRIEKSKSEWKEAKIEVVKLEGRKDELKAKEKDVEDRVKEVSEREDNLLELHKVLENRKKILNSKEKDLQVKQRRA